MKYYIASGLDNFKQVQELRDILNARGWEHTYDWTLHGAVYREGAERLREVAEKEVEGVYMAEVVIVILPGGRGTHLELGAAVGLAASYVCPSGEEEPRICIYSPDPEKDFGTNDTTCAFYHHPLVERFSSWDEMIATFLTECGA